MPTIHSCSLIERCLTFRRTGLVSLTRPVNGALWLKVRYGCREVLISSGEETDMLRLFVSASIFVMVLGLAGLPARAQSSSDATSKSLRVAQSISPTQQEEQRAAKSVACRKQAKEQKLSGSERRAFLKDCMTPRRGCEE